MIDAVENKINAIKDFLNRKDEILLNVIRSKESEVADLVIDEQLMKGIDSEGNQITPPYTPYTVRRKIRAGQPFDRVTLRDTGDFHRSIFLRYNDTSFEVLANDPKVARLVRKYGGAILGLTNDNIDRLANDIVKDDFIETVQKMILDA